MLVGGNAVPLQMRGFAVVFLLVGCHAALEPIHPLV